MENVYGNLTFSGWGCAVILSGAKDLVPGGGEMKTGCALMKTAFGLMKTSADAD